MRTEMNNIMIMKKNYPCPTSNAISKMIDRHISAGHSVIEQTETQLAEDEQKIENLSLLLSSTKEKLDIDKSLLEDKTKQLDSENQKLKELEAERNRITKSNYDLGRKCHKLRSFKPNVKDQHVLDLGQKKYNLYKELTRIRWDYGVMDQATKGFVSDKKDYIHIFSYPNDMGSRELSDRLWREIELSTGNKSHDNDEEKENSLSNV